MSRIGGHPLRQIHLDFHTSPHIGDVAADWDPELFADTMAAAHVESVTVFATCHHGLAYFPSSVVPVHPALDIDLLGEQIESLHARGIRAPVYVTVGWNVSAADRHPEWQQVRMDGTLVRPLPTAAPWGSWPMMCLNSGYADEVEAVVTELLDRYDVDGFFFDIVAYPAEACACVNCLPRLRELANETGGSITDVTLRRRVQDEVVRSWMRRISARARAADPDIGLFYNSRWGMHVTEEIEEYSQLEIESLATGGWGYDFFPLWARFGRTLGLPFLGMTGRFALSWADWGGLKHPDALRYDAAQVLAAGGGISVGDQLPSRGRPEPAVYEVIGEVFEAVAQAEPYCVGATPIVETALLIQDPEQYRRGRGAKGDHVDGCGRMLLELHRDFDVVTPATFTPGTYDLLVIPDRGPTLDGVEQLVRSHVEGGGALLFTDDALTDEAGNIVIGDLAGIHRSGRTATSPDYYRVHDERLLSRAVRGGFAYTHYRGGVRVEADTETEVLALATPSHFDRTPEHFSSHFITAPLAGPAGDSASSPAITVRDRVAFVHGSVFSTHERFGHIHHRELIGHLLDIIAGDRIVTTDAPATATIAVHAQPADEGERLVVHVVNYHSQRNASGRVESLGEPIPLHDVSLRIRRRTSTSAVRAVFAGTELVHHIDGDYLDVVVPRVEVHEIVVIEP